MNTSTQTRLPCSGHCQQGRACSTPIACELPDETERFRWRDLWLDAAPGARIGALLVVAILLVVGCWHVAARLPV